MASVSEQHQHVVDYFNTAPDNVRNGPWEDQPLSTVGKAKPATVTQKENEKKASVDLPFSQPRFRPTMRDEVPDSERDSSEGLEDNQRGFVAGSKGQDVVGGSHDGQDHKNTLSTASSERLAAPVRPAALQRQGSHNSADEGDSVLDLYGSRVSSTTGVNEVYPNVNGSSTAMYDLSGDTDNTESSRWIHRDKLLRIESQENSAVGEDVRGSRWGGPNQKREAQQSSLSQSFYPTTAQAGTNDNDDDNGDNHDEEAFNDMDTYELKRPGERSAERTPMKAARRVGSAGSYSRIPLSITSPIPVPQEYIERTTPLRRRESNSPELHDGVPSIQPRMRSKSVGSGTQLDSDGTPTNSGKHSRNFSSQVNSKTSTPSSPRRPSSANRPGSNISHTKSRSRSQPGVGRSNSNAPTGSSASKHAAPQGPPPWSLSAYSPDPKLPPDQQLIPTVAKRLQQEQWERDGVYASVYDRKLRPLKVHENEGDNQRMSGDDDVNEWPLKRNTQSDDNPQLITSSTRPPDTSNQAQNNTTEKQPEQNLEAGDLPPMKERSRGCCGCSIM